MARTKLTSEQIFRRIEREQGRVSAVDAARRILRLGDSVGAQRIGRQASVSVRLPGPESKLSWLTLFLVQGSGNFTVWYTYRWKECGLPQSTADRYGKRMRSLFGGEVEDKGVPVTDIVKQWNAFEPIVRETADRINSYVERLTPKIDTRGSRTISALEGIVSEARVYRYSRSGKPRKEALNDAMGVCSCCGVAFAKLLGGRGSRVLQVHHKKQLSTRDRPKLTKVADLAVVCANCHMLIHADPQTALRVEAVRALWRNHTGARLR